MSPWLEQAIADASEAFFGKPAMYMGEGGTIPFMGMLGEKFPGAQFMITGVLGPHSNAHGPNEFLHIPMGKRVTACVAHVIAEHQAASVRGETTAWAVAGGERPRRPRLLLIQTGVPGLSAAGGGRGAFQPHDRREMPTGGYTILIGADHVAPHLLQPGADPMGWILAIIPCIIGAWPAAAWPCAPGDDILGFVMTIVCAIGAVVPVIGGIRVQPRRTDAESHIDRRNAPRMRGVYGMVRSAAVDKCLSGYRLLTEGPHAGYSFADRSAPRSLTPAVHVVEADDVVLAEVVPDCTSISSSIPVPGILQPMNAPIGM